MEETVNRAPRLTLSEAYARLPPGEIFWRDHQVWLQDRGYMLRARYQPDWIPSWQGTTKNPSDCEDSVMVESSVTIDARRVHDNADVCLKLIDLETFPFEHEIGMLFSSEPLASHPQNHCVPILETLQVPDDDKCIIIVMPLLRPYSQPRFDTFGEAVDFFSQVFEGLKFMHDHNVAHRDCNGNNIMMDPSRMFPNGFHPVKIKQKRNFSGRARFYTRTQRPPKYYLIDFGLSRRYETRNPPPLEHPIRGGDKSVPEFQFKEGGPLPPPCDPFPTDVYYLGNTILRDFVEGNVDLRYENRLYGFEFMSALAYDMVAEDPAKRPTMDEVVERFAVIRSSLGFWKLRSRVAKAGGFPNPVHPLKHWLLKIGFLLLFVPAIPSYKK